MVLEAEYIDELVARVVPHTSGKEAKRDVERAGRMRCW